MATCTQHLRVPGPTVWSFHKGQPAAAAFDFWSVVGHDRVTPVSVHGAFEQPTGTDVQLQRLLLLGLCHRCRGHAQL